MQPGKRAWSTQFCTARQSSGETRLTSYIRVPSLLFPLKGGESLSNDTVQTISPFTQCSFESYGAGSGSGMRNRQCHFSSLSGFVVLSGTTMQSREATEDNMITGRFLVISGAIVFLKSHRRMVLESGGYCIPMRRQAKRPQKRCQDTVITKVFCASKRPGTGLLHERSILAEKAGP